VPGARAGAARMQAPKCRRQSSAVTYVLGSRVTVAGGGTFVLGAIVVAASGIAPRATSDAAAVGTVPPRRLLPRLGLPAAVGTVPPRRILPRLGLPPRLLGGVVAASPAAGRRCWSSYQRKIWESSASTAAEAWAGTDTAGSASSCKEATSRCRRPNVRRSSRT
jgi:hypothetical protein